MTTLFISKKVIILVNWYFKILLIYAKLGINHNNVMSNQVAICAYMNKNF